MKLSKRLQQLGADRGAGLLLFDEPTTGLHFADVSRLLGIFDQLTDRGETLIVIEHHPDVIAHADWVIDLGPGSGEDGGRVVAEGTPEEVARAAGSATGRILRRVLSIEVAPEPP